MFNGVGSKQSAAHATTHRSSQRRRSFQSAIPKQARTRVRNILNWWLLSCCSSAVWFVCDTHAIFRFACSRLGPGMGVRVRVCTGKTVNLIKSIFDSLFYLMLLLRPYLKNANTQNLHQQNGLPMRTTLSDETNINLYLYISCVFVEFCRRFDVSKKQTKRRLFVCFASDI